MKKSMNRLALIALLAFFNAAQSLASSKAADPLEDFAYISRNAFSVSVNVGLYFDKPSTLTVSLDNDPAAQHDGNLRSLSSSFGSSEELLTTLFGDFMFQVLSGKDSDLIPALLAAKEAAGEKIELSESGKPAIDMSDIIGFALKSSFEFERLYSTGGRQGVVKLSLIAHPNIVPDQNWVSFPHPILEAGAVGMHVIRSLMAQAHNVSEGQATMGMFL